VCICKTKTYQDFANSECEDKISK